jgi:ATP-dependent phosphofructokinase / diphosphate-dependent phosphofructokinase
MSKKVGIVISGGDVPGLNAVIASMVQHGLEKGYKFFGFIKGWEGILDMQYVKIDKQTIRGISHTGGAILHSVNRGRFSGKAGAGDKNKIDPEIMAQVKTNLEKIGIDALVVIGGDGTLSGAYQLWEFGVNTIGVPRTIDNDLNAVDQTLGFSTAINVAVEAIDRVHTTTFTHDRVMLVETMGRHAGWIALYAGIAAGADAILLPEFDFEYSKLIDFLRKRKESGRNYAIIVVAEGAKAKGESLATKSAEKDRSEVKLGGITEQIMSKVNEMAPGEFEIRNVVLGHIQRGGTPDAEDRILAKTNGAFAIDAIESGKFGTMVALRNGKVEFVPLNDAVKTLKNVTKDSTAYQTAQKIGVFLGE